ncbi:MAG: hypothetical protein R6W77_15010 [Trueperaceae bacterium]
MKTTGASSKGVRIVLAGVLAFGAFATAQEVVTILNGGSPILATFLDKDKKVLLADVAIDGGVIGHRYGDDIEDVVYTTLSIGGVSLRFNTAGNGSKNSITVSTRSGDMTLADVVRLVERAAAEGRALQIEHDDKGYVTHIAVAR